MSSTRRYGWLAALCLVAAPAAQAEEPSLDDLLGLPTEQREAEPATEEAGEAPDRQQLRSVRIGEEFSGDPFRLALLDMKQAADLLGLQRDAGLETQRAQERAIRRLDQLLDQMERQQSASQQAAQQDDGSEQNVSQQQDGQQAGDEQGSEPAQDAGRRGQVVEQELEEGPLAEHLAEWGHLPPRMRDQLLQGLEDRFSSLYRQLTEQYYQRLAEEAP